MPSTERSFYLLKTRTVCVIFLYNCMQCIDGSSILLPRYVTKGNDAKNLAFLAFVCYRKNPVKCNARAVARKIETDCFSRNVPFSSDPVVRISRNLANKQIREHVNDLSQKISRRLSRISNLSVRDQKSKSGMYLVIYLF